jgi:hypothetical protein
MEAVLFALEVILTGVYSSTDEDLIKFGWEEDVW